MNETHRPPGFWNRLLGTLRVGVMGPVLVVGTMLILGTAWMPWRIRGARMSAWPVTFMARLFLSTFGIERCCTDPERIRRHHGLIFPNHLSFLDVLVLSAIMPVRFLSNHVLRKTLFVGWIAQAIGTVFVDRSSKASRAEARARLSRKLQARAYPPIVLFPEGHIGPGDALLPVRYGAFEVAIEAEMAYLPCVLNYNRLDVVRWRRSESFWAVLWRTACRRGTVRVEVVPLEAVQPLRGDDAEQLAIAAEVALGAVYE